VRRGLDVANDFDVLRLKELPIEQFVLIYHPIRKFVCLPENTLNPLIVEVETPHEHGTLADHPCIICAGGAQYRK
jgi:hypothetical protein